MTSRACFGEVSVMCGDGSDVYDDEWVMASCCVVDVAVQFLFLW